MDYREVTDASASTKQEYAETLEQLLQKMEDSAWERRAQFSAGLFENQEHYRNALRDMLGWPLTEPRPTTPPAVTMERLAEEEGYTVYRMQFDVLDGVKLSGILFRQNGDEPRPLVLAQHGKEGTPELISGMYGHFANYNDMIPRLLEQGVHVFAPQLLLWAKAYEVPYDRDAADVRLKRLGGSIAALEIYELSRVLDYFETQPYVTKFGMVGLSYGGFYTLFTTALDTRICSAVSCSFFNTRDHYIFPDWGWFGAAHTFDDAEIACLVYPRRICLAMGDNDIIFDHQHSTRSYERICALAGDRGTDWVSLFVFDGIHEFRWDDASFMRLIDDLR